MLILFFHLNDKVDSGYFHIKIRSPLCDIFGVPLTYETHMCLWLLVKTQIVEWDFKVILRMRMQYHA